MQAAIELLSDNPRPPTATQLVGGQGEWRVRVGDYRIVYEIHEPSWSCWSCGWATGARSTAERRASEGSAPTRELSTSLAGRGWIGHRPRGASGVGR
jgi:ParE toxin of type II toxin-antitoxin system, parDE